MSQVQTKWSEEFLEQKRQQADKTYDDGIRHVLEAVFLNDDHRQIFADWHKRQSQLIAEATQIADELPKEEDLPQAIVQRIEQLCVDQQRQFEILLGWKSHIWSNEFQFHIDSAGLATLLACKALANGQLKPALSAMNCALTNAADLQAHFERLIAQIEANPDFRKEIRTHNLVAYNRFLQISDDVRESPDLFLCEDSFRKAQFKSYPEVLHDTFTPGDCPGWVDEEKLRRGFELWQEHMAGCVLVLFTHSLPACYISKGIAILLCRTQRIEKQEYLAQRMYETGFLMKDVMDEGGLKIIEDTGAMHTAWFAAAVHKIRPDLNFELGRCLNPHWLDAAGRSHSYWDLLGDPKIRHEFWTQRQIFEEHRGAVPGEYSASELGSHSFQHLFRDCIQRDVDFRGRRLWGRGFVAATKVRYLHASIRYMVLRGRSPDDVQEYGQPINQEDLAYVLLTFGYLIPLGMEKLGAIVSREEKEAFLHCWKVVGYIMGVGEDLLTDDWDDAKYLYEKIKNRRKAPSEDGVKLTGALCTMLTDVLPAWMPRRSAITPVLIRDQMGDDADDLFDAANQAASRDPVVSTCWAIAKVVLLRPYFLSRHWFFNRIPAARAFIDSQVQFVTNSMIECFKQTYERHRFDLFAHEQGIAANPNITEAEHRKRAAMRDSIFAWVGVGMVLILLLPILGGIGIASLVVSFFSSAAWLGVVVKWMFWLCVIDVIGVSLVQSKLKRCLKELAFKVPSKFLI